MAHLRPHISNLKATFVFLRSVSSRLLYDITARRLKVGVHISMCGLQFSHHPFSSIFLSLHGLINVLCALWRRIIHQTKWPGSVQRQAAKVTLSLSRTLLPAVTSRGRICFIFLSVGNVLWQSNNLFFIPFWMSNNVRFEGNDKGVEATGVVSRLFWSAQVAIVKCTSMGTAGCSSHRGGFIPGYDIILQSHTSNTNSIISQSECVRKV